MERGPTKCCDRNRPLLLPLRTYMPYLFLTREMYYEWQVCNVAPYMDCKKISRHSRREDYYFAITYGFGPDMSKCSEEKRIFVRPFCCEGRMEKLGTVPETTSHAPHTSGSARFLRLFFRPLHGMTIGFWGFGFWARRTERNMLRRIFSDG